MYEGYRMMMVFDVTVRRDSLSSARVLDYVGASQPPFAVTLITAVSTTRFCFLVPRQNFETM
jgi:hypothetical protein